MHELEHLDVNARAVELSLLGWELDIGLTMATLAFESLQDGSLVEYERLKAHATDALQSCVATAERLIPPGNLVWDQVNLLAHRVALL